MAFQYVQYYNYSAKFNKFYVFILMKYLKLKWNYVEITFSICVLLNPNKNYILKQSSELA